MTTDNICYYLQNRIIQTSQTGGQQYSDTSPPLVFSDHSNGNTIYDATEVNLQQKVLFQ
jgi:hypothetical protein